MVSTSDKELAFALAKIDTKMIDESRLFNQEQKNFLKFLIKLAEEDLKRA